MKNYLLLFFGILVLNSFAGKIEVKAVKKKIGSGTNHAFSVMIYEANAKDVSKAWKKLLKKYDAEKVKRSGEEVFADNIMISSVFVNPMDIYSTAIEVKGNGVEFIVGVDMGGAYMNKGDHPTEFKAMASMIEDFATEQVKEAIDTQIKQAEDSLKDKEDEQKKLEKDKADLEGKIEGWKKDIEDAKSKIEQNKSDQEKQKAAIESQKKLVEEIKAKKSQY